MHTPEQQLKSNGGTAEVVNRPNRRIGAILAQEARLEARDIREILALQKTQGIRFGQAALRLGLITVDDLQRALAIQYDVPHLMPDNSRVNSELVVAYSPFDDCAEQLRTLRTQLQIRWSIHGERERILAVVSAGGSEGRSYVTANLAVAFSQLGLRTLLVDADLRSPRQHRVFDIPNRIGLSAVLSQRADRSAVVPVPEFGKLYVLSAGARPPNPLELLSGERFPLLLAELKANFDVIMLDTPAARVSADAQTIAYHAGSALLLARRDNTQLADAGNVLQQMRSTGVNVVGTVFNSF